MHIKIGADPEVFVFDTDRGVYVSAHDLIPGTKQSPHLVPNGAVQVDGVAAEYNIFPASTMEEFIEHNLSVMDTLTDMVRAHSKAYELRAVPTVFFDQVYFDNLPEYNKLLGCEPDYNAYTGEMNTPPETNKPMRTGAGHLHIGWDEGLDPWDRGHMALCRSLVQALDDTLFDISRTWDSDTRRRSLYGNKGAFRPKHYGLEYRPLSNAWVGNVDIMALIYTLTEDTVVQFFKDEAAKIIQFERMVG